MSSEETRLIYLPPEPDEELEAIEATVRNLNTLDPEVAARVARYIHDRFTD